MTTLPGEEWLAKQEPKLRGGLSKAALSLSTIVGPLLLILSQAPTHVKVAGSIVWVLLLFSLWLLSWLAIYRTKVRELEGAMVAKDDEAGGVRVTQLELALLNLFRARYPETCSRDEIDAQIERPKFEMDAAIMSLFTREPNFIVKYKNTGRWGISTHGMAFLHRRDDELARPASIGAGKGQG